MKWANKHKYTYNDLNHRTSHLRQVSATNAPFLRIKVIGAIADVLDKAERYVPIRE